MDTREKRAGHEGRVLRPQLAVDRARERLRDQLGPSEAGEGVEVTLLLLGRRGRAEAAEELVVARGVARVRQDRDERGEDVGVHVAAALDVRGVEGGGRRLHGNVVAKGAERACEVAAELAGQLVLVRAHRPAELREGRRQTVADEEGEAGPVGGVDDAVERVEGRDQDGPNVAVALTAEARRQVAVIGEAPDARDGDRPGVVDQVEALDRREVGEVADESLEELRRVSHAVEAVAALVDDDGLERRRRWHARIRVREDETVDRWLSAGSDPELDGHAPVRTGLAGGRSTLERLREVGEPLLAQDELTPFEPHADERIARLEDPTVHNLGDRLTGGASERGPQVARLGVPVRVSPEIVE